MSCTKLAPIFVFKFVVILTLFTDDVTASERAEHYYVGDSTAQWHTSGDHETGNERLKEPQCPGDSSSHIWNVTGSREASNSHKTLNNPDLLNKKLTCNETKSVLTVDEVQLPKVPVSFGVLLERAMKEEALCNGYEVDDASTHNSYQQRYNQWIRHFYRERWTS